MIWECEIIDEDNKIFCNVFFRLFSFNMIGFEFMNRIEEENVVSVMDFVRKL